MRFQLLDILPNIQNPVTGRLVSTADRLEQAVASARQAGQLGFDAVALGERDRAGRRRGHQLAHPGLVLRGRSRGGRARRLSPRRAGQPRESSTARTEKPVAHQKATWKLAVRGGLPARERGEIDLDKVPPAVLTMPLDLMRHDLLMTLKPVPVTGSGRSLTTCLCRCYPPTGTGPSPTAAARSPPAR